MTVERALRGLAGTIVIGSVLLAHFHSPQDQSAVRCESVRIDAQADPQARCLTLHSPLTLYVPPVYAPRAGDLSDP